MVKSIKRGEIMDNKRSFRDIKKEISANAEIERYDIIESTNIIARERIAEGCRQWHTIVADSQTGGSGRMGRSFFSPCGTGLYMSCVLYPSENQLGLITGMAAVSVCEVLEKEFKLLPKIKWVNDIFIDKKKVCGILAKSVPTDRGIAVILGIGINVFKPEDGFPEDIKDSAGYLFEEKEEEMKERLLYSLLKALIGRYEKIGCDDAPEEYRKRCLTVGRDVTVIPTGNTGNVKEAKALFVDDNYHLTVEYENGERETLSSGEVSVKI